LGPDGQLDVTGLRQPPPLCRAHSNAEIHSIAIPPVGRARIQAERKLLDGICKDLRLDVLDLQSLPAPKLSQTRVITTLHDLRDRSEYRRSRIRKLLTLPLLRSTLQNSYRLVVPSPQVANELRELLPEFADKVRVVPAGMDPAPESPEAPLSFFLHVGRDEKRKRLDFLLESYAAALRQKPDLELLVQVGADRSGRHDRMCRQLGIEQRVIWMGEVSGAALTRVLSDAIALVFPSALEGFGLPVLEAMAHGTPSLVVENGAPSWVMGPGGLALPELGKDAWANALLRLSTDEALRATLSASARERAADFSIEGCTATWLEGFHSAIQEGCLHASRTRE
jgi:glycosyltransferase involved in cell wall biosynthesis